MIDSEKAFKFIEKTIKDTILEIGNLAINIENKLEELMEKFNI